MKIIKKWSADSIRTMCINCDFYTKGNNEEYSKMLNEVDSIAFPTDEDILKISANIESHSKEQTVSNVMFHILNTAIAYIPDLTEE